MKAILQDDNYRIPHKDGTGFLTHIDISEEKRQAVIRGDKEATQEIASEYNMDMDSLLMEAKKERERLSQENKRVQAKDGGPKLKPIPEDNKGLPNLPEKVRNDMGYFAEGGEIDNQMSMLMSQQEPPMESEMPMESDEEMEDNYLDFILDEALTEEEEDMLMSKLEQDEQLSMLFDKVVEVASEFAGSGPVEGPGTGVSDSIPARLSDGEFVFTAKAVEEIGADELMRMMKDAEMRADERQGMANGGEMDEEENVVVRDVSEPVTQNINVTKTTVDSPAKGIEDEDELTKSIRTNMMMRKSPDHVRS